jgi:hypothetical protein
MKNAIRFAVSLSLFLSLSSFAGVPSGGIGAGNGGDTCEAQIKNIRTSLEFWLTNGGPEKGLKLPKAVSLDAYENGMLKYIVEDVKDASGDTVPNSNKAVISCTDDKITVNGAEKTCRNYNQDPKTGFPSITCNFNRFNATEVNQQFFLIHHEYAGLAGLEVNDGPESQYTISNQITGYLRTEEVTKLAIVDPTPTLAVSMPWPVVPNSAGGSLPQNFYIPTTSAGLDPVGGYTTIDLANTASGQITLDVASSAAMPITDAVNTSSTGTDTASYLIVSLVTAGANPVPVPLMNCNLSTNCGGVYGRGQFAHAILIDPNHPVQVTLNLSQACQEYYDMYSVYPMGCTSFINPSFTATSDFNHYSSMMFVVGIYNTMGMQLAGMGTPNALSGVLSVPSVSGVMNLTLNAIPPQFDTTPTFPLLSCKLQNAYQAGDQGLVVDGSQFAFTDTITQTGAPDGLSRVAVLAKETGSSAASFHPIDPILATESGSLAVNARIAPLPGQVVTGFQAGKSYSVGFIGVDLYGYLMDATSSNDSHAQSCAIQNPVQP